MKYFSRFAIISENRTNISVTQSSVYKKYIENVTDVCRIFVLFTIFSCAYYHGRDLLWKDEGDLLSPKMRDNLTKNKAVWKPRTCSMHNYTNKEFAQCWSRKECNARLLFLGDSHERALYYMFRSKIQDRKFIPKKKLSIFYHYEKELKITLEYDFMPLMNDSVKEKLKSLESSFIPDLIVIGSNLHPIWLSNASKIGSFRHRKFLTSLLPHLDKIARQTTVLWYIQPPVIDYKMKKFRGVIKNKHVDLYNRIAMELLSRTRIKLWTSAREIAIDEMDSYSDDIHVGASTCEYYVQILSNFWCNEKMDFLDGTCCKEGHSSSAMDSREIYFIFLIIIVIVLILLVRKKELISCSAKRRNVFCLMLCSDFRDKNCAKIGSYSSIILKFLLTITYVYICERIPVFPKDEICLSQSTLLAMLMLGLVMAIYFCSENQDSRCVLRSCVINETKGLTIMILLISKVAYSSEVNPYISMFCESAFILMMGVELFYHSWCGKTMSFRHFIQALTDMNILATLLCLTLRHPYIEYGVLPVTLLSYTLSYVVLALSPRSVITDSELSSNNVTKISVYVFKISALVVAFTVLHCSTNFGRQILSHPISRSFFATKEDSLAQWLLRWKFDKFSFLLGIAIGFLSEIFLYLSDLSRRLKGGKLKIIKVIAILLACSLFTLNASLALHSSFSPMAGGNGYPLQFVNIAFCYVLFRSYLLKTWAKYSKILATLGPFWLEIYLLHFHIWMAFDGYAFLVLLPFSSILNFSAITFIMLFVASDIRYSMNNVLL